MANYIFKTTVTMKPYNSKNWWIDSNIITEKYILAENVNEALEKYRKEVLEKHYISISDNALKRKEPMYVNTASREARQCGYVITGKTDFETDYGKWVEQYIDLWVNILTVVDTEFQTIEPDKNSISAGGLKNGHYL